MGRIKSKHRRAVPKITRKKIQCLLIAFLAVSKDTKALFGLQQISKYPIYGWALIKFLGNSLNCISTSFLEFFKNLQTDDDMMFRSKKTEYGGVTL